MTDAELKTLADDAALFVGGTLDQYAGLQGYGEARVLLLALLGLPDWMWDALAGRLIGLVHDIQTRKGFRRWHRQVRAESGSRTAARWVLTTFLDAGLHEARHTEKTSVADQS